MLELSPQVSSPSNQPSQSEEAPQHMRAAIVATRVRGHLFAYCGDRNGKLQGAKEEEPRVRFMIRNCIKEDLLDVVRAAEMRGGDIPQVRKVVDVALEKLMEKLPPSDMAREEALRAASEIMTALIRIYESGYHFKRDMQLLTDERPSLEAAQTPKLLPPAPQPHPEPSSDAQAERTPPGDAPDATY